MGKIWIFLLIVLFIILLGLGFIFIEFWKQNSILFKILVKQERKDFEKKQQKRDKVQKLSRRVMMEQYTNFNIFYPKLFSGNEKVVINLHGGAFITGNKDYNNCFNAKLSEEGCVVISIEYPLAPESNIEEMLRGIQKLIEEAMDMLAKKMDNLHEVILVGNGSGALLALYISAINNSAQISRLFNVDPSSYVIKGLGLISGAFLTIRKDDKKNLIVNQIWGENWKTKYGEFTSVDFLVKHCELPPLYIFTSSKDKMRIPSDHLFRSCVEAEKVVHYKKYKNEKLQHSFAIEDTELEESKDLIQRLIHFIYSL